MCLPLFRLILWPASNKIPSKKVWLVLLLVYTFDKTPDTLWHIHLMFYPVVEKPDAIESIHQQSIGESSPASGFPAVGNWR
ncbi:hypothetical protein [Nostoc sp.]|uniref:hypothetical protein n=1 Tax=Nostoc sp. TaxID=1180 RepID=UPI002FFAD1AA